MKNGWIKLGGVVGIVYALAGFVLIFLGWNGAASNDAVSAQIPYVISGGLAGLGLVVVGAGLMVAQSLRADRVELRAALDDLRDAVAGGGAAGAAGRSAVSSGAAPVAAGSVGGPAAGGEVVVGSDSYHRPDCTVVAGHAGLTTMSTADAEGLGRSPCRICQPDVAGADATV